MLYPKKMSSKKADLIIGISIIISILIGIMLFVINKLTSGTIQWAALANSGIIYIWVTVMYSINKNINIAGHVLIQTIAISILTLFIDYELGFKAWSTSIAIPIIIIVANITMLILTIVTYKRYIKYAIYQIIIILFSMIPIYLMFKGNFVNDKILSIIAVGVSILNLVISLIICRKDIKEEIIRKFHI